MAQTMEMKKPAPQTTARHKPRGSLQRGENAWGIAFVSPMLIGVIILVLFPILATLVLGFADWNFVQGWDGIRWAYEQGGRKEKRDGGRGDGEKMLREETQRGEGRGTGI